MPLLREEAERMAEILEAMLARLSWPQDADHIINIRSTLEIIRSTLFNTLVDIHAQSVEGITDAGGRAAEGDRVDPHGKLLPDVPEHGLHQLKETSVDDGHHVVDITCLHPTVLISPAHDCIVLDNHVAMEMQEPLGDSHNTHHSEQNETTFVTNGNSMESDECISIITNTLCEPDKPLSPCHNHDKLQAAGPKRFIIPNEGSEKFIGN